MNATLRLRFGAARAAVAAGLIAALAGCDSNGPRIVSGKLLSDGQPLKVSDKGVVQISFEFAENPDGSFIGAVNPDGTFTIEGPTGDGIVPNTYRVGVVQLDPYPGKDLLKGKFAGRSSPIVMAVDGKSEVVIDLAQVGRK